VSKGGKFMRHFLQYWKSREADRVVGKPIDHAGSAQFTRVKPDDIVWIVTLREERLILLGRILVSEIISRSVAQKRFAQVYDAPLHIVSKSETAKILEEHDIQDIAPDLRFASGHDRFTFQSPMRTDGKQLQSLRELRPESAKLLAGVLLVDVPQKGNQEQTIGLTAIVKEIERKAEAQEIGHLQKIRKELKSKTRLPYHRIFHPDTIKEKDGYAFHYGGRTELQFNIGFEPGNMFRHGVAFSLEPSQTLPDIALLLPKVKRFNELLTLYPQQFSDMAIWHWVKGDRKQSDHYPSPITPDLMKSGFFIFLGKMQPANAINYDAIVEDFDRLLALYRFVEGNDTFPKIAESATGGFDFRPGCTVKLSKTKASLVECELDVYLRQNDIQIALHDHLASLYGPENVGTERWSGSGRVDVMVRQKGKFWFYEIKTALSARGCIVEALAQLLEYSYWPGAQLAEKLIIVGEPALDRDSEAYLATLREQFSLPIEYQQFDFASGMLVSSTRNHSGGTAS
jgi:hypothetical protein